MNSDDLAIAVVGCGRWGKNLIRVFDDLASVSLCCHTGTRANQQWLATQYPAVECTTDLNHVLEADVDAVAIATPIDTHYDIARQVMESGIDVFVEKPLTADGETARELADLASSRSVILGVGYVFVYHPAFRYIEQIQAETPIEYVRFEWRKLGGFDEDIVANLASHDLAMAYHLFRSRPNSVDIVESVQAAGGRNIATLHATFENARCQVHLNRLDSRKRKTATFVTESGDIYLWQDDTVMQFDSTSDSFQTVFETDREPLKVEIECFLDSVRDDRTPLTDGEFGATVTELFNSL